MKLSLLILSLPFFISSCQTYQYITIDSKTVKRDSSQQFIVENDTVLLQYNFSGFNGPIKVTVHNKLDKPLYIDWKRSAMIVQGKAVSYHSPDMQLNGSYSGTQLNWGNGIRTNDGSISAEIRAQEGVDFLPPHTLKEKSSLFVMSGFYEALPESRLTRQHADNDPLLPRLKFVSYDEQDSPFRLRSYLTFYTSEPDSRSFAMEQEFFISSIGVSINGPDFLPSYQQRGDRFYTSKISGFTKAGTAVIGIGLLTGLAMAAGDR